MTMLLLEAGDTGTYRRGHRDSPPLPEEARRTARPSELRRLLAALCGLRGRLVRNRPRGCQQARDLAARLAAGLAPDRIVCCSRRCRTPDRTCPLAVPPASPSPRTAQAPGSASSPGLDCRTRHERRDHPGGRRQSTACVVPRHLDVRRRRPIHPADQRINRRSAELSPAAGPEAFVAGRAMTPSSVTFPLRTIFPLSVRRIALGARRASRSSRSRSPARRASSWMAFMRYSRMIVVCSSF